MVVVLMVQGSGSCSGGFSGSGSGAGGGCGDCRDCGS